MEDGGTDEKGRTPKRSSWRSALQQSSSPRAPLRASRRQGQRRQGQLLDHENVIGTCYSDDRLLIRNKWEEVFEIVFMRRPNGEFVGHANKLE